MPSRRCEGSGARGRGSELLNPAQLSYPDIQLRLPRHVPPRSRWNLWTSPHHQNKIVQIYAIEYNTPQNPPMFFPPDSPCTKS